jgi:hypothetical protein
MGKFFFVVRLKRSIDFMMVCSHYIIHHHSLSYTHHHHHRIPSSLQLVFGLVFRKRREKRNILQKAN